MLSQVCALDLLQSSPAVRDTGVTLLPIASPPVFSLGFQRKLADLQRDGRLRALHLTSAGDFAPKLKGSLLSGVGGSGVHGVTQRLVLNPKTMGSKPYYYVASGEDDECEDLARLGFDVYGHNLYAKDMSGIKTLERPFTVPEDWPVWPVPETV